MKVSKNFTRNIDKEYNNHGKCVDECEEEERIITIDYDTLGAYAFLSVHANTKILRDGARKILSEMLDLIIKEIKNK